ncbi:MAG: ABC transporter permease [Anaerolineales bacterium]|jgi:putative ABC transport system permease protein
MSFFLSFKEIWRNKGRYLLFSLVIALITTLVLFIAALAGGLSKANREYIDNIQADLLVYQDEADLIISASRLDNDILTDLRRMEGVADAGGIGFSSATVVSPLVEDGIDVSLIGTEPGRPGNPEILDGRALIRDRANEAVIDTPLAESLGVKPGDQIVIQTVQGTEKELFDLTVVGLSGSNQYFFQPAVFTPIQTWDDIKPQDSGARRSARVIFNIAAVQFYGPENIDSMIPVIERNIDGIQAVDKQTAILSLPGYTAQQSTLNTQQAFTLLIGVLVLGGFFQIQTIQKIAQIGMLKAIGTSNGTVAGMTIMQIITISVFGVVLGVVGTLLISLGMPQEIPAEFNSGAILGAIAALLIIGPIGGLVSIRLALKVEPLRAIGL